MKIFRAIPSYYGGKQKLVKHIFKYIPAGARLLDGFMGAGSVSLFAKWRGHELISNDYSFLSRVIGEALINNSRARIQEHWITEAMKQEGEWPWEEEFTQRLQRVLLDKDITILAKLINYAYDQEGAKKWLMLLLAMKYFAYMLPFGGDITNLRTPKEYKKAEFTKWTETDAKQVRKFREDRIHRLKSIAEPTEKVEALKEQIEKEEEDRPIIYRFTIEGEEYVFVVAGKVEKATVEQALKLSKGVDDNHKFYNICKLFVQVMQKGEDKHGQEGNS